MQCTSISKQITYFSSLNLKLVFFGVSFYSDRSKNFGMKSKTKRCKTHFSHLLLNHFFANTSHVFDGCSVILFEKQNYYKIKVYFCQNNLLDPPGTSAY